MRPAPRAAVRGHSMVELMAALSTLTVIAGSMVWIGGAQLRGIARSRQDDAALRAVEARIATLRAQPRACAAGERPFAPERVHGALPGAAGTETLETVSEGLVRATVEVEWDAADGGRRSLRLVTLVAQEDVP